MRQIVYLMVFVVVMVFCCPLVFGAEDGLVAWWSFDQEKSVSAQDSVGGIADEIKGSIDFEKGVSGNCIRFDGYTSRIVRAAGDAPELVGAFTIEAWIAPQTYAWRWAGIVDQAGDVAKEKKGKKDLKFSDGLYGVTFSESDFTGPEKAEAIKHVNHEWTGGHKDWAGRWRGYIESPFAGEITFAAEVDNGIKLEVDGKVVIDGLGRGKSRSGKITLDKGKKYPVVLSYFQKGDPSFLRLSWSWSGQEKGIVSAGALSHSNADVEYVKSKEMKRKQALPGRDDRISLGIDERGHVGMKVMVEGKLVECRSDISLELLKWAHVVGTFDKEQGINLYVDGKSVGSLAVKGSVMPAKGHNLYIGKSQKKMSPVGSERKASARIMSNMIFDGLIDEVKIYNKALSPAQVGKAYAAVKPAKAQPLSFRVMPSGPKDVPNRFGASYTRLMYAGEWEKHWRVSEHSDILITFEDNPVRLVFWRGTAYGALWVAENGKIMADQSLERSGGGKSRMGCAEHMSDKQCRFAHVRLIENNEARIVLHWRYAINDILYDIFAADKDGWGEWGDEYYYIYPDAVSTRKQILWSKHLSHEWQETIILHQPGTTPEDNLELDALTLANMEGDVEIISWAKKAGQGRIPKDATIQIVNMRSENRPFIIWEPGSRVNLFQCCVEPWTHFAWWNHWPVGQIANDGRRAPARDRPAHSSLVQSIEESDAIVHDKENDKFTAVHLIGMGEQGAKDLMPLAKSWNRAAKLNLTKGSFENKGYDKYQRAYVLKGKAATVAFELAASEKSPLVNCAVVIEDWGEVDAALKIDGKEIKRGKEFRFGHYHSLEGSNLIVWIEKESVEPVKIEISPKN
ncbi:MAG: LamG-like jellyroll fold domain-containing protein [Planctomycetota bacterium]|jgi:hypothetical protein